MAVERAPRTQMVTLAKGKPWERKVTAESIRIEEGTVDESGIRHINMTRDDSQAIMRHTILKMKRLGYTVDDTDPYEAKFTIKDSVYREQIESEQHRMGLRQLESTKKSGVREFTSDTLETSKTQAKLADILGDDPE